MSALQFIVGLLLIFILAILGYAAYCVIENKPFFPTSDSTEDDTPSDPTVLQKPDPDSYAPGTCTFEGEDFGKIFDFNGKKISKGTKFPCSNCNQYIYKDSEGCVLYTYDFSENLNVESSKMMDEDENGVCTASLSVSKKCPF